MSKNKSTFKIVGKRTRVDKTLGIRISIENVEQIKKLAKQNHITLSELGRQMIEYCLGQLRSADET